MLEHVGASHVAELGVLVVGTVEAGVNAMQADGNAVTLEQPPEHGRHSHHVQTNTAEGKWNEFDPDAVGGVALGRRVLLQRVAAITPVEHASEPPKRRRGKQHVAESEEQQPRANDIVGEVSVIVARVWSQESEELLLLSVLGVPQLLLAPLVLDFFLLLLSLAVAAEGDEAGATVQEPKQKRVQDGKQEGETPLPGVTPARDPALGAPELEVEVEDSHDAKKLVDSRGPHHRESADDGESLAEVEQDLEASVRKFHARHEEQERNRQQNHRNAHQDPHPRAVVTTRLAAHVHTIVIVRAALRAATTEVPGRAATCPVACVRQAGFRRAALHQVPREIGIHPEAWHGNRQDLTDFIADGVLWALLARATVGPVEPNLAATVRDG
mmetsp:Transcript_14544/g.33932  ORF Transcript_14544/g.33932 Transcript_14544/m.33932 type:complete len:384 (+) Transcript_14544:1975-3126(+)